MELLGAALAASEHFDDPVFSRRLDAMREGFATPDELASWYVLKDGMGQEVVAHLFRIVLLSGRGDRLVARARLMNAQPIAVWSDVEPEPGQRERYRIAHDWAARAVARTGLNRCVSCGTELTGGPNPPGRNHRLRCDAHRGANPGDQRELDVRRMRKLLEAAHVSLFAEV